MRRLVAIFLCLSLLVNGCKSQPLDEAGLYQRPGWWERRMDRLDDWNAHHGHPIQKAKSLAAATLVVAGAVACVAGVWLINDEPHRKLGQSDPFNNGLQIYP